MRPDEFNFRKHFSFGVATLMVSDRR